MTAARLFARKRPRLRPIYDSVVAGVTKTERRQWEPLRLSLRMDDLALHRRRLRRRDEAELPTQVSALRVLDVVAWMEGMDGAVITAGRAARPALAGPPALTWVDRRAAFRQR